MFLLYNLLFFLLAPFWLPWMLWRASRRKEKPNWRERFGSYNVSPHPEGKRVWLHAVSVGEVFAAIPILRELRSGLPDHEILLSVTTSSGHQAAREQAAGLFDHLVYFPIDFPKFQLRAMERVRPRVVTIMETELWMNFLWAAKVFRAKTLLVNGRVSDRSFPRAMKLRGIYRTLLGFVDRCLMQGDADAARIKALGARSAEVLGNVKFDQALEGLDANPASWRRELGLDESKLTLVIGSTRGAEEEAFVFGALRGINCGAINIVWAPRHLERADAIAEALLRELSEVARRSRGEKGRVVLLDTYGELSQVYSVADMVVVGGGFANLGGQNLVQPLALGRPVLHGLHMQNFADVARAAGTCGAARACGSPDELRQAIEELLNKTDIRESMGRAGRDLVAAGSGAAQRYGKAIIEACRG